MRFVVYHESAEQEIDGTHDHKTYFCIKSLQWLNQEALDWQYIQNA
jgi:hypothetical protein